MSNNSHDSGVLSEEQETEETITESVDDEVILISLHRRHHKWYLNMEMPMLLMFFAVSLSGAVINNMLLDRACRVSLALNDTICDQLHQTGNHTQDLESRVQAVTTLVIMGQAMVEGLFPAVLSLFLGAWSNKYGRKPLFTWPLCGYALTTILVTAYSLLPSLSPWWFVATSLPYSFSGGGSTLFTGAFCHMTDITTNEDRSLRIAILESSVFVGSILGSVASPWAQSSLGTPLLLLVTSSLAVAAYAFANLLVTESKEGVTSGSLRSVFDTSLVRDMLNTCFKWRPNYDRASILLLVVSNSLSIFVMYGLFNIDYMYARNKLHWGLKEYSIFSAVNTSMLVAGMLLGVGLLQKTCRMNDAILAMVSLCSSIVDMVCRGVATAATNWLMYLGGCVSLLRGLASPLIRVILSKNVSEEDLAKVFAMMSALEAIFPLLSPVVFSNIYRATLDTLPEAVYIVTICFYFVSLVMLSVATYFMAKYPRHTYTRVQSS